MGRGKLYGGTAWGRWFVEALEGFDESGRLSRGKSYANTGKVVELEVRDRVARAKVAGHSRPWYHVSIAFPPLSEREARDLAAILDDDPMLLARVEAGDYPPELVDALKAKGIDLIPRSWRAMKRSCDCPDWGDPCKHMAAVYYLLAREIDREPRLLFALRGVELPQEKGAAKPGARDDAERPGEARAPVALSEGPGGEAALPEAEPAPPAFESYAAFIISLMPPTSSFSGADFRASMAGFYHAAAASLALEDAFPQDASAQGEGPRGGAAHRVDDDEAEAPSLERAFSSASYAIEIPAACAEGRRSAAASAPPVAALRFADGSSSSFGLAALSRLFLGFSSPEGEPGYRFLFHFFRLLRALRGASALIPSAVLDGPELRMGWVPLPSARDVREALDGLAAYEPGILRARGKKAALGRGKAAVAYLAEAFLTDWARGIGYRPQGLPASEQGLAALFFSGEALDTSRPGERSLPNALASWLAIYSIDFGQPRFRLTVKAAKTSTPDSGEALSFRLSLDALVDGEGGRPKAKPLAAAAREDGPYVLRGPAALSAYLPELRSLATQRSVAIEEDRLALFLGDAGRLLSRLGVEVVLPRALSKALSPRLALKVDARGRSRQLRSYLDLNGLLSYDWRVAIGDRVMSVAEFERLARRSKGVVLFREGYVRLDPDEAARLIASAKAKRTPTALDAIAARLSGDALFSADAEELASSLFRDREVALPRLLEAELRPYQERGYRWIASNLLSGFGCLLADDMGLGKTVQAIAVMAKFEEEGLLPDGVLVVAPAALLSNWERELARFAPALGTALYHGPRRAFSKKARVHLTTYQTAARDAERLSDRAFSLLVVDEAHLLKNAATKASLAVKSLKASYRLALSGTPVENRLEDLRSILDFAVPGYLGGPETFRKEWRVPIEVERSAERAEKLRRITSPFLMRRLKTDKSVIRDLPEKVEVDEYARLAPEQAALYEAVVSEAMRKLESAEGGIERQALILGLLTSLKEICDHPRVYDKESPEDPELSGKCALLLSLLGDILERREKVLVFSQYVESLKLLKTIIRDRLREDPLLYHGGMSAARRDEAVTAFQSDASRRVMLVSLKAGGLGLNLTAASRVIHFDLWFNPAVESQATDRAFRIGQTKNVFVHRLITADTFEEKIDAMLKSKRELAQMSVASGESWLSKMSDEELRELFS